MKLHTRYIIILIMIMSNFGCAMKGLFGTQVNVDVTSSGLEQLGREKKLQFMLSTQDFYSNNVLYECIKSAKYYSLNIADENDCKNESDCNYVSVKGNNNGDSIVYSGTTHSYNALTNQVNSNNNSYKIYKRQIIVGIYKDKLLVNKIHEITLNSDGTGTEVVKVAYQMCRAGFKDYPARINGTRYSVPID